MISSFGAALTAWSQRSAPRNMLFWLISSALLAICVIFAVVMADARSDNRKAAETSELNLTTALARDLDRNVELLDLSIQAARDTWADPRVRTLDTDLRQLVLFDHSASASYIDAILLVDRNGEIVADSRSTSLRLRDVRSADFFKAQVDHDAGLFIGRPMPVIGKSGWHVALSRRMTAEDGSFSGVAVGFMSLDYLAETYRRLPLGPGGVLLLFNADGTLLVREPESRAAIGRSFRGQTVFGSMTVGTSGTFEGTSTLDGRNRLFAFRHVGDLPLIQAVGETTDAVYAPWLAKAKILGVVLLFLCLGIMGLLAYLRRELSQRIAAERALEALASTDHLTGLLNRRKFFALAEERRIATAERGLGLSVIMLDADYFKCYNDRYGHVAGDDVLARIGRCITSELRSGHDLAARYGGEEFIVLLPEVDMARAFVIAEAIRSAVLAAAVPHDRSPTGLLTVSVGVASAEVGAPLDLGALVEAADAELYRSKREGRNRSSIADPAMVRADPVAPRSIPA